MGFFNYWCGNFNLSETYTWFIPPISLVFIILKYILLPLSVVFIIMLILIIPELFSHKTMAIRDAKPINRVQELINQGHKVLIVRVRSTLTT